MFTKKIMVSMVISKSLYPVIIAFDFFHIAGSSFESMIILPLTYGFMSVIIISDFIPVFFNNYSKHVIKNTEDFYVTYNISDREKAIVEELIKGLTYQEIGDNLYISINTVRFHIRNIYKKSSITSKVELMNIIS